MFAEKALQLEKDKLQTVFSSMKDGVYIVNAEYDLEFVNKALTDDFGQYKTTKCHAYFCNRTDRCPECTLPDVLQGETVSREWTSKINGKIYSSLHSLINNTDGSVSKLTVLRDISCRKMAEKANMLHLKFLKDLDRISTAILGSTDAEQMMSNILQTTLDIFGTDRAFLLYPCDPDAESLTVPMECTSPKYPGALVQKHKIPMTAEMQTLLHRILKNNNATVTDSRNSGGVETLNKQFAILSRLQMAIHPQRGKPWLFGLHQCSHHRKWNEQELELFREIGNRLAIGLDNLLLMQDLRNSEEKFKCLSNASTEAVFFSEQGICLGANHTAAEMFGWERPSDFIGIFGTDVIAPESRELVKTNMLNNRLEVYEATGLRRDGTEFPISIRARTVPYGDKGMVRATLILDITEQRKTENSLRISSKRLKNAQRISSLGNWELDIITHSLVWSDEIYRIFELDPDKFDASYEAFLDAIHPEDRDMVNRSYAESIKNHTPYSINHRLLMKDGRIKHIHEMCHTTYGADGQPVLSTGTVQDITAQKEAEELKQVLERQMQHTQKLESLGVLAGGIAHNFNNILMAILGNADLALTDLSTANPARSNIKAIIAASKRAVNLSQQMLAYSGKGKFHVEQIDLNDTIGEIIHILEVSISKKAVIKCYYANNLPLIKGDATQIRQMIMSLVTNASDAIHKTSGVISITTGAVDCDRDYLAGTCIDESLDAGQYVYVEVTDTGNGMNEETLKKMFDPFFSTKFTGRGLGLSAVLGIIRGHKGTIKVYSEPSIGTSIKVLLPGIPSSRKNSETGNDENRNWWTGSGTVLLVDDEETILSVCKQMLERLGFDVLTALDGREAVKLFQKHSENIVFVLMDLVMPHLDGEQTFRELRRISRGVQVIMCSGYNEQEVTQRFAGKSLSGFLHKPYMFDELKAKVREILEQASEIRPQESGS